MDIDQAVPLPPVQVEQQESISNVDTIIKLNESIKKKSTVSTQITGNASNRQGLDSVGWSVFQDR
jgi:hypothetical protein